MLALITVILLPLLVFGYYIFFTRIRVEECFRRALITLGVGIILALPVGQWETHEVKPIDPLQSNEYVYVAPCQHHLEGDTQKVHMTPIYTSLVASVLNDDATEVAYCDKCHTRKEAIKLYIAQR
jgi:hypothetical protein